MAHLNGYLGTISSRTVDVNMNRVTGKARPKTVTRLCEALDTLEASGFKINYVWPEESESVKPEQERPASRARAPKRYQKPSLKELSPSELRSRILDGVRHGEPSREIYDSLREEGYNFGQQSYAAHWRYVHNGAYARRKLL